MNISLAASGKVLPVPFARGYINALWLATRTEVWKGYYRSAVGRFVPADERNHWLHLLDPYLSDTAEKVAPLDYTVLRLLHANMLDDGKRAPQAMRYTAISLTSPTGEAWWVGSTPLDTRRDYGLQQLLTPHILAHIDQNTDQTGFRVQGGTASVLLATRGLVESLSRNSGIAIAMVTQLPQIIVRIDECPFCSLHPNCHVFWGVMVGYLDWLHRAKTISEIRAYLQLNTAASTAHHLVLDLLE